jgi:hypothetical protein
MTRISPTSNALSVFSPRTADYVAALIREGDKFDYSKWLQRVREKAAQAKPRPQMITKQIVREELEAPVDSREASPNRTLFNGRAPTPIGMTRSQKPSCASTTNTTRRLEKVRDAWNEFQASRTRDAVYGYLEVVFAIVAHYKVRRRTKRLRRCASEFAGLPFHKNADPFTAVIRCTCDDTVDNKTISKWARALRYVAHCKVPTARLKSFMKKAGGVNACADKYVEYLGRGAR